MQWCCLVLHFFLSAATITIRAESSACFWSTFTWLICKICVITWKVLVCDRVKILIDKGADCVNIVRCVSVMLCDLLHFALVTHLSFEWIYCATLDVHLLILIHSAAASSNNINASVRWLACWSLDSVEFDPVSLLFRGLLSALLRSDIACPAVLVVATEEAMHLLALRKCLGLLHSGHTLFTLSEGRLACVVVASRAAEI